jgi:protein PhnA
MEVKDSNGTLLNEGDNMTLISSLKAKGSAAEVKRGQWFKNIRLTSSEEEIEGRTDKVLMVLKPVS